MAYTKQNFEDGQVLKAEHLNNIEEGIVNHAHKFSSLTSKPTTLSGYGITDAYNMSSIDSMLSELGSPRIYIALSEQIDNPSYGIGAYSYHCDYSFYEIFEIMLGNGIFDCIIENSFDYTTPMFQKVLSFNYDDGHLSGEESLIFETQHHKYELTYNSSEGNVIYLIEQKSY